MCTTKRIGLVDADMLVYLAGFVTQRTRHTAVWYDFSDIPHQEFFPTKAAMKEWQLEHPEQKLVEEESFVEVEPLEHTLAIVKNKMQEMDDMCKHMEVYIKGDGNFRESIATLYPYKGNRTAPKPVHYEQIRQYLKDHWGAVEVHGKEADDQITTRARQLGEYIVICHADKDLDQIPGLHWNYQKNVWYEISQDEALLFFYQQILMGDYADNVRGCWKMGEGGAKHLVDTVYQEWLDRVSDEPDLDYDIELLEGMLWEKVVEAYENSMGINGCPYAGMPAETVALENARLLWMQDEPLRLWTPPGYPAEYLKSGLDD